MGLTMTNMIHTTYKIYESYRSYWSYSLSHNQ
jgi:hypothetical protein